LDKYNEGAYLYRGLTKRKLGNYKGAEKDELEAEKIKANKNIFQ